MSDVTEAMIDGRQICFLVTNPDDSIMSRHKDGRFYEEEELALIKRRYTGGTVLDIGAHVGNHAVYISKFTDAQRIIVFEPNQTTIPILKENLRLNHCDNVDTQFLGVALAARAGRLRQHSLERDNSGYTFYTETPSGDVPSIDGDSLVYDEPIGFIKLDVEGMELQVLQGLQRAIQRWRPVMLIEMWDTEAIPIIDWLDREGYETVERIRRHDKMFNSLVRPRGT